MRKTVLIIAVLLGTGILLSSPARAQRGSREPQQPVGCIDPTIRAQADEIKKHFTSQGFVVYRDAMINMESMEPFPVMVQLAAGHLYQIIFVGHPAAKNHKIVVYDGADNKMDEKFVFRNYDQKRSNYIIYQFVPERTDTYLFTFMTRLKREKMCGSVCIVAADQKKGAIEYKPYVDSL